MNNQLGTLADEFSVICRRVCRQCSGSASDILLTCPIIKADAYLYLKRTKGMAAAAKELKAEIETTVDDELIRQVSIQQIWVTKHNNGTQANRGNNKNYGL